MDMIPTSQTKRGRGRPWSESDVAVLLHMQSHRDSNEDISIQLGRTEDAIADKLRRMGMHRPRRQDRQPKIEYTPAEVAIIQEMAQRGCRPEAIRNALPGRVIRSVVQKMISMRLRVCFDDAKPGSEPPVAAAPDPAPEPPPEVTEDRAWAAWSPPPKTEIPPVVIGPAKTCQFPRWESHRPPPRPAPFCDQPVYKRSLCRECFSICWRSDDEVAA